MIKLAAVQAAPVWLDAKGTADKTIALIEQAGRQNIDLLAFGEVWLPGYPYSIWLHAPLAAMEVVMAHRQNAIKVDGPEMRAICDAAKRASVWTMLGYAERDKGSIYCSQALISDHGRVVLNRRKLRPTHMERTVWGEGNVEGLTVVETPFGMVGGLCCWENLQPINRQGLMQLGEQIHVACWPGMGMFRGVPGFHAMSIEATHGQDASYALQGGCFVLSACLIIPEKDRERICMGNKELLPLVSAGGGAAAIFGPDGSRLTQPLNDLEDGLAVAEVDLAAIEGAKVFADPGGHYFRADVARFVFERIATPINPMPKPVVVTPESKDRTIESAASAETE